MEGNRVLTEFASLLKKVFRGGDLIFRQGGDEFLVVLPDTTEQQAQSPLQRLLESVQQWNAEKGNHLQLAATWGMAGYVMRSSVGRSGCPVNPPIPHMPWR